MICFIKEPFKISPCACDEVDGRLGSMYMENKLINNATNVAKKVNKTRENALNTSAEQPQSPKIELI